MSWAQANELGEIEVPAIVMVIEFIDNVVVVFFSVEYLIRCSQGCWSELTIFTFAAILLLSFNYSVIIDNVRDLKGHCQEKSMPDLGLNTGPRIVLF